MGSQMFPPPMFSRTFPQELLPPRQFLQNISSTDNFSPDNLSEHFTRKIHPGHSHFTLRFGQLNVTVHGWLVLLELHTAVVSISSGSRIK